VSLRTAGSIREDFTLSRRSGVAAVPCVIAVKCTVFSRQTIATVQMRQQQTHVSRLIGAGVLVGRRNLDRTEGDDGATLAATPRVRAGATEHDERAGDDRAGCIGTDITADDDEPAARVRRRVALTR
jgi:hypothetical protein